MEIKLDEDDILARFDRLVDQGMVVYNQDYRTVTVTDQELPFEFRILSSLTNKPQAPQDQQSQTTLQQPGYRPGSDIDVSGYEAATLGSTHLLALNKFPAARPHLLILTQDGFRRQHEALDMDDITAGSQAISSFKSRYLLLFNCGINSGCSRMHKHMHIFPAPDRDKFSLWLDSDEPRLPFKFFMNRFHNGLPSAAEILDIYRALLRQAERAVGGAAVEGGAAVPHNVIMDRNWLVVIPRRSPGWEGADTNAAGMLGMIWVHNEEKMKIWLKKGPANVLSRIGIPADENWPY
ncbi:hypothetical protein N657DRAFT_597153 [Parathielavia appendiculata]|uniref:ATP adenylyltransferase n=1 Tax=Parathielavia appendiculata TaxID=2587402 RepID=A0AAN6TYP6_9PEZI|nr:hypothetical protein N657DRAFT_597153 [Parathielavia appendiculata]